MSRDIPTPPEFPRGMLYGGLVTVWLLVAVASQASLHRLWGVHHLAYFSPTVRWTVLLLAGLSCIPVVATRVHGLLVGAIERAPEHRGAYVVAGVCVAILATAAFTLFPAATELLGDGQLQASLLRRFTLDLHASLRTYVAFVLREPVAPVSNIMGFLLGRLALAAGQPDPLTGWRLFCSLLGGGYVVLLGSLVFRRDLAPDLRLVIVAAGLLTGALHLFFGYVETYTPAFLLAAIYVYLGFRAVAGSGRAIPLVVVFAATLAFHAQALLLLPSLAWILARRGAFARRPESAGRLAWAIALATVVVALIARSVPATSGHFLPWTGGPQGFGALSPRHLLDMFDEVLLVAPLAVVLAVPALVLRRSGAAGPARGLDPPAAFALLLAVPCTLFLWLFRPELGMAHDWDLYVLSAAGTVIPVFVALHRAFEDEAARRATRAIVVPGILLSAAIVLPWLAIGASESRSVRRYEDIVAADRSAGPYAYEILAMHHRERHDPDRSARAWHDAYAVMPQPRFLFSEATTYYEQGDTARAVAVMARCVERHPDFEPARRAYVDYLSRTDRADDLLAISARGMELFPADPYYAYFAGIAALRKGRYDEADADFARCLDLNPPADVAAEIEALRERLRRPATH